MAMPLPPAPFSSRGRRGGGSGGGRGHKSAATKLADKARLAALMAARKAVERAGGSWDPISGCAVKGSVTPAEPADDEVECMGETMRQEAEAARDVAIAQVAVDLDSEDEAIGGGPAEVGGLEGITLSFADFSQDVHI